MKKCVLMGLCLILAMAFVLGTPLLSREQEASAPTEAAGQVHGTVSGDTFLDTVDSEGGMGDAGGSGDDEEADVSTLIPVAGVPTINAPLSWEQINAMPVKYADMSVEERRRLVVDFMYFSKTATWTPDKDITYIRNGKGSQDKMSAGIIYGGLPYVGVASGSVYRLMNFIDDRGVVDIYAAVGQPADATQPLTMAQMKYFGSQCSIGAWWGWARVINSADYLWTYNCIAANNFLPLTDEALYDYSQPVWEDITYDTAMICGREDEAYQQMLYRAYAALQPGDGAVCSYQTETAGDGHVVMIYSAANVQYNEDGTIDPDNSFVELIDQAQTWKDRTNQYGDKFKGKNNIDPLDMPGGRSFTYLREKCYVPFTFQEFIEPGDEISFQAGGQTRTFTYMDLPETELSFSHSGGSITLSQLYNSTVTGNYGISDVYVILTDDTGKEIYRHMTMSPHANDRDITIAKSGVNVRTFGTMPESGSYHVEIEAQLGTGERPTVYVGTLIV